MRTAGRRHTWNHHVLRRALARRARLPISGEPGHSVAVSRCRGAGQAVTAVPPLSGREAPADRDWLDRLVAGRVGRNDRNRQPALPVLVLLIPSVSPALQE